MVQGVQYMAVACQEIVTQVTVVVALVHAAFITF